MFDCLEGCLALLLSLVLFVVLVILGYFATEWLTDVMNGWRCAVYSGC